MTVRLKEKVTSQKSKSNESKNNTIMLIRWAVVVYACKIQVKCQYYLALL